MTTDPEVLVRERRDGIVEDLLALLAIDTQNPPGDTAAAVDYLEAELDDAGIDAERITDDRGTTNLVGWIPGEREETLVFNGHLDTVPFDREDWHRDPLGERDGETIYGRGATDMKGAVAAMLADARVHRETDGQPPMTLAFAFVSDEEVLAGGGLEAVLSRCDVAASRTVIGEMTGTPDRPSVTAADKGGLWLTLEATGEAAHGSRPMLGVNAIDRLYATVADLADTLGDVEFDLDPEVDRIVDRSVPFYEAHMSTDTARHLFERPTLNLGTIEGGEAINSVPAGARAEVDVRVTASADADAVLADIREVIDANEGVEIANLDRSEGTFEPVDSPLVDAVATTSETVTGERTYRRSATGGGDAKTIREAGLPAVEFALATETAHAVDEHTTVPALLDTAEVYARLPATLASRC